MTGFQFDQTQSFEENCEAFVSELESRDAELAGILRQNWGQLLAVVQDGESNSRSRTDFNAAIGTALDALILETAAEGDD